MNYERIGNVGVRAQHNGVKYLDLVMCTDCGALVVSEKLHDRWHENQLHDLAVLVGVNDVVPDRLPPGAYSPKEMAQAVMDGRV